MVEREVLVVVVEVDCGFWRWREEMRKICFLGFRVFGD